jgi:hypothetical protein
MDRANIGLPNHKLQITSHKRVSVPITAESTFKKSADAVAPGSYDARRGGLKMGSERLANTEKIESEKASPAIVCE